MRLYVPTANEDGLDAAVSDHFGSAPVFAVFAGASGEPEFRAMPARQGGGCGGWRGLPLGAGDVVVCRHIGSGALRALTGAGIPVLRTEEAELRGVLRAYEEGRLRPFAIEEVHSCGGAHH